MCYNATVMFQIIKKRKLLILSTVFFAVVSVWWFTIYFRGLTEGHENELFTIVYPFISLFGGVVGLFMAKRWGGYKSILGRAIGAFSLGLLGQAFGQASYNFYIVVLGVEVPYPSIGDFGFFSTGIFYAYGLIQLMKAVGAKFSLKSYGGKAIAIVIPVLWAFFSYWFFLRGYVFDWSNPVVVVLDLISPIIDGAYLSLAILAFILSKRWLGGLMKWPMLLLLAAIVSEAITDFTFIYQVSREQWYIGGINDYMYLITYTLMTLALIQLGYAFSKLTDKNS